MPSYRLNKNPGVRPVGICKTARQIIAKAVLSVLKFDIMESSGPLQLCAGQVCVLEAAVKAVRSAFNQDPTEGVLLVDASNAFNVLNHQVALHNPQYLCPPIATILINCYRSSTDLFVDGITLQSSEGLLRGIRWPSLCTT